MFALFHTRRDDNTEGRQEDYQQQQGQLLSDRPVRKNLSIMHSQNSLLPGLVQPAEEMFNPFSIGIGYFRR
jgi:hypothetical protein